MIIVVEELVESESLSQEITINQPLQLGGIRLYLYSHNDPAGTFQFDIKHSNSSIYSDTFTASDLKTDLGTSDSYVHMWYSLTVDPIFSLGEGVYTFELSDSSGYTFSDSSFFGWVKPFENRQVNQTYPVTGFNRNPFGIELWSYNDKNHRR